MKHQYILLLASMLTLIMPAFGQNSKLSHIDAVPGNYAIVRQWQDAQSLTYTQSDTTKGIFILEDSTETAAILAYTPTGMRVFDYEIVGDTAYFCGNIISAGAENAVVGFFDIPGVFYNGGSIQYTILNLIPLSWGYCWMSRLWRMTTYETGGTIHIAAVGACELDPTPGVEPRATIIEASYTGTNWICNAYYNKDGNEYYTDIATTNDYIVAAAMQQGGNACYAKVYNQVAGFLSSPLSWGFVDQVIDGTPTGKVLVEALYSNDFALACYYSDGTEAGCTLKTFSVTPGGTYDITLGNSYRLVQNPTGAAVPAAWRLRDIRYNKQQQWLAVLQDMDYPTGTATVSATNGYDIYHLSTTLAADLNWIDGTTLYALGRCQGSGFDAVGDKASRLQLFMQQYPISATCSHHVSATLLENTPNVSIATIPTNEVSILSPFVNLVHQPIIAEEAIENDCQQ